MICSSWIQKKTNFRAVCSYWRKGLRGFLALYDVKDLEVSQNIPIFAVANKNQIKTIFKNETAKQTIRSQERDA